MRGLERTRLVAELAARQHGTVSRKQLRELGFSDDAIDRRVRADQLHRVFRGVYAVGHPVLPSWGRAHGAVLAYEPGALLSHRTAAELWGLTRTSRWQIDVTTTRKVRGQRGIAVHYTRSLHPDDVDAVDGIPVTSLARTLLDYAAVETKRWLHRAWDQ